MKQIVASILLIAFLSFQLSELIIYVSFKINQDYIAKNLCVEKDVEGSTCKGCCQLDKKLNEQEKQKQDIPLPSSNKSEFNLYSQVFVTKDFAVSQTENYTSFYQNNYHFLAEKSIFHPPQNRL